MRQALDVSVGAGVKNSLTAVIRPADAKWRAAVITKHLEDLGIPLRLMDVMPMNHKPVARLSA